LSPPAWKFPAERAWFADVGKTVSTAPAIPKFAFPQGPRLSLFAGPENE
jgi:hypothetical protein